jgi:flagellar hook-associated protein 2
MSTSGVNGTLGNAAPISFPGIVSGIDYNAIIQKLTQLSLAPTVGLNAAIATLNSANTELNKINSLLQEVQSSLATLSNPDLYDAYGVTSSNSGVITGQGIPGESATPGIYTLTKVQTATATSVLSCTYAGHSITDALTSGPYSGQASNTVPLVDSYAAVTPSNGSGNLGQITVDGVSLNYNVDTYSLNMILNDITNAVDVKADPGFLATLVNGVVEFTSSDKPISLGSASDQGNLLQVLRLSNAQLNDTSTSGSIVGTANVGGINVDQSFDTANTAAGFRTPVTAGYFTINGVKIDVAATQSANDIINEINASAAGVVATYNQSTGQIELSASATGPQSIVLGAPGDTSNFLTAAGLTSAAGATTQLGSQAEVDVLTSSGGTQKYFSNSNTVTSAIPGISLNLQSSYSGTTPITINVQQSTTQLVSAVQGFVSAYNAAVSEINAATAPPVVAPAAPGSGGQAASFGGGVLWNNSNAQAIVQQLEQIVSGFLGSSGNYIGSTSAGGSKFFSLSQIGLQLSDTFSIFSTANNQNSFGQSVSQNTTNQNGQTIQQTSLPGTDGTLQPLDVATFVQAFESNPSGVADLLNGAKGLTSQLGAYLTTVTGSPTILDSGPVGVVPSMSLINNFEDTNNDAISSLQQQVQQLTDNANTQADNLRAQFVASETLIAQLQAEQQQLAAVFGFSVSSSSSSSGA